MSCAGVHSRSPWAPAAPSWPACRRLPLPGSSAHSSSSRSTCCCALRLAVAADLPALIELEALTGGSWTPQQVEVTRMSTPVKPSRPQPRASCRRRGGGGARGSVGSVLSCSSSPRPRLSAAPWHAGRRLRHTLAGCLPWSQAELLRERATVLVADDGSGPVGWAVGWAVPQELHLMNIAVHPNHQRCGHARALLTTLFNQHRCGGRLRACRDGTVLPHCCLPHA